MQSLIYACRLRQLNSIEGCLTCHHELTHDIRFYDNHQGSMTSTRLRTLIAQWPLAPSVSLNLQPFDMSKIFFRETYEITVRHFVAGCIVLGNHAYITMQIIFLQSTNTHVHVLIFTIHDLKNFWVHY